MKKIAIRESGIQGKGIFAEEAIKKGQLIQYITGKKVKKLPKTKEESLSIPNWFGLSRHFWIDPEQGPFRYLNHSCEPNAAIKGTKSLVAMRDIAEGEEVTMDYSMTDADPLWEMECSCEATRCRKTIRSIHSIPTEIFKRHMPYIPRYFQRVYLRNYVNSTLKSGYGYSGRHSGPKSDR